MQELMIIGNLGKDAEIKGTNGNEFMVFTVAVTEKYKDLEGVQKEKTNWYDCINKKTDLAKFIKKGEKILVRGKLQVSLYKDKEGNTKVNLSIQSNYLEFLSKKPENQDDTKNE
ncbi:MAG: single-stranded DNA-binding protein [Flavobacterium sp.]|jgi:single-strand DNA-binding protein|nr:single-stranded DNA-binding protein [Flavobacterium sp.]MCU0470239.1 single-stranded DNA-binding protein [Arcicella sp.]